MPMDFQVLGHVAVPRLYRRHFYSFLLFPRVQEPAAIRLRLRVFQTPCLHIVMLNLVQHLTASLYLLPLLGEILKRVQDDGGWCRFLAPCIVMLKFAVKREQRQARLSYAEREQISA